MTHPHIAVIGAGNMGACLIGGLIKHGHSPETLWAADPGQAKLDALRETFGIHISTDNHAAARAADVVIFAVKPNMFAAVVNELKDTLLQRKSLIISIVTGIRIDNIQAWLHKQASIVRAMPNTPALIGCGATALYANHQVSDSQRNIAESILRAVGITVWLSDENLLDAVTALSGSGPAYFFHMMESLQLAGEEMGLPRDIARLLTLQTAFGSARMALESGKALDDLRKQVTSPGGTTEKALSVLDEHRIHLLYKKAIQAAKLRSEELAQLLGEKS